MQRCLAGYHTTGGDNQIKDGSCGYLSMLMIEVSISKHYRAIQNRLLHFWLNHNH